MAEVDILHDVERFRRIISEEERTRNKLEWITFYRRNIHRFVNDYLGIKIYPHQQLEFYAMSQHTNYAEICSRNTAKSWKAGVYACARCILYPKTEFVIVAESKKQAAIIIEKKIRPLYNRYENLNREILKIISSGNDNEVHFKNGSMIFVVALRESARGNRATDILQEERRRLDTQKLNSIISPFKHPRQADFLKIPKYANMAEEPRTITLSSSGRDTDEWYKDIIKIENQMLKGKSSMVMFVDYIMGLRYNMVTAKQIANERQKMDEETFQIEYENALVRENKDSFFPQSLFTDVRSLKIAYYPQHPSKYDPKRNPFAIPKQDGEYIVVSVDIALKASDNDDNTIISVGREIPTKKGFQTNLIYQETMRGKNSIIQALRIKQIWYDFSANYIVIDTNNAGAAIYDIMTEKTIDTSRGLEYPAMTSMYHKTISKYDDYKARTRATNAIPIIYPMWATDSMNSDMAFLVRDCLKTDKLKMMCSPNDGQEYLYEKAKYFDATKDLSLESWFMRPYYQASETQSEMQNLRPIYSGTSVKLVEPSKGRKDRYSSLAYLIWFTKNVLDPRIVREDRTPDMSAQVLVANGSGGSKPSVFGGGYRFGSSSGRRSFFH